MKSKNFEGIFGRKKQDAQEINRMKKVIVYPQQCQPNTPLIKSNKNAPKPNATNLKRGSPSMVKPTRSINSITNRTHQWSNQHEVSTLLPIERDKLMIIKPSHYPLACSSTMPTTYKHPYPQPHLYPPTISLPACMSFHHANHLRTPLPTTTPLPTRWLEETIFTR